MNRPIPYALASAIFAIVAASLLLASQHAGACLVLNRISVDPFTSACQTAIGAAIALLPAISPTVRRWIARMWAMGQVGPTLASRLKGRENNVDFLRFIFACMVIYGHVMQHLAPKREFFLWLTDGETFSGRIAVDGFFALSGFLILQSWTYEPHIGRFAWKRALRLLPAFALGALILTPTHALRETAFLFIPTNLQTWTIRWEVSCYGMVAVLGLFGIYRRSIPLLLITGAVVIAHICTIDGEDGAWSQWTQAPRLIAYFLAGMCFFAFSDKITFSRFGAIFAWAAIAWGVYTSHFEAALILGGPYLLFWFAFHVRCRLIRFGKAGDASYGIYLWGWAAMVWTIAVFKELLTAEECAAVAILVAVAIGYASWHLVEKWALLLKGLQPPFTHFVGLRRRLIGRRFWGVVKVEFVDNDG